MIHITICLCNERIGMLFTLFLFFNLLIAENINLSKKSSNNKQIVSIPKNIRKIDNSVVFNFGDGRIISGNEINSLCFFIMNLDLWVFNMGRKNQQCSYTYIFEARQYNIVFGHPRALYVIYRDKKIQICEFDDYEFEVIIPDGLDYKNYQKSAFLAMLDQVIDFGLCENYIVTLKSRKQDIKIEYKLVKKLT